VENENGLEKLGSSRNQEQNYRVRLTGRNAVW